MWGRCTVAVCCSILIVRLSKGNKEIFCVPLIYDNYDVLKENWQISAIIEVNDGFVTLIDHLYP